MQTLSVSSDGRNRQLLDSKSSMRLRAFRFQPPSRLECFKHSSRYAGQDFLFDRSNFARLDRHPVGAPTDDNQERRCFTRRGRRLGKVRGLALACAEPLRTISATER
jgi:hypothetical protein